MICSPPGGCSRSPPTRPSRPVCLRATSWSRITSYRKGDAGGEREREGCTDITADGAIVDQLGVLGRSRPLQTTTAVFVQSHRWRPSGGGGGGGPSQSHRRTTPITTPADCRNPSNPPLLPLEAPLSHGGMGKRHRSTQRNARPQSIRPLLFRTCAPSLSSVRASSSTSSPQYSSHDTNPAGSSHLARRTSNRRVYTGRPREGCRSKNGMSCLVPIRFRSVSRSITVGSRRFGTVQFSPILARLVLLMLIAFVLVVLFRFASF